MKSNKEICVVNNTIPTQNESSVENFNTVINPEIELKVDVIEPEVDKTVLESQSTSTKIPVLTDTLCRIRIQDIVIPEVLDKLYDSKSKTDKIKELKASIGKYGQKEPIIVIDFQNQTILIDGHLRIIALEQMKRHEVTAIYTTYDNETSFEDFILQHHIRKELTLTEKANEIRMILRINEENQNPNRDLDKRRGTVSLKLGNKFQRSSVIDLENIMLFERDNSYNLDISESVIGGKIKVAEGKKLIGIINDNDYTPEMEQQSSIVRKYLKGDYNLDETERLIKVQMGKNTDPTKQEYPQFTPQYEVRLGGILDVDLSDVTFDVIFTSPPYFHLREYGESEDEIGNEATRGEYIDHLVDVFQIGWSRLAERGSLFVNLGDTYEDGFSCNIIESFVAEMESRGMKKVDTILWEKPSLKPSNNGVHRLYSKTEYILHFAKSKDYIWNEVGKPKNTLKVSKSCGEIGVKNRVNYIPNRISRLSNFLKENDLNNVDDFLRFSNVIKTSRFKNLGKKEHNATFDETLPLIPLLLTCPRDRQAIVGDLFAGTSTTGEAAMALGHKFVGVELYKTNVEISNKVLFNAEQEYLLGNLYDLAIEPSEQMEIAEAA